ncbi:MAG: DNA-binding protein [Aestuariivirga sp.]
MTTNHLNQLDLSRRWAISPRTLERWRWQSFGPDFVKVGGRVLYRLIDVERFEAENLHQTNAATLINVNAVKSPR